MAVDRTMRALILCTVLASLLLPDGARAETRVDLSGLAQTVDGGLAVDTAGFQSLALDLGNVLGSHSAGPAVSGGALGIDVELDFAYSPLGSSHRHWEAVGNTQMDVLKTLHLAARKGLPLGFQLGAHVAHLLDSRVWSLGTHLKYSILEGTSFLPDVAVRSGISAVLGVRSMSCFAVESDLTISKRIGLFGVVALTPYAAYSLQFVQASTNVMGTFNSNNDLLKFVIPRQQLLQHRGIVGFQLWMTHATLSIEAIITGEMQTYAFKLGANL